KGEPCCGPLEGLNRARDFGGSPAKYRWGPIARRQALPELECHADADLHQPRALLPKPGPRVQHRNIRRLIRVIQRAEGTAQPTIGTGTQTVVVEHVEDLQPGHHGDLLPKKLRGPGDAQVDVEEVLERPG